ncbi:hypothetical protein [Thermogymnomonas acidicola]|uniref:hypothetical protein n=1 Tax=Thermogymnomonas acidicola TaxID=399579 RepID=UPI0009463572|nr:hypothetical protein [Thermogymnomonas acidicola]
MKVSTIAIIVVVVVIVAGGVAAFEIHRPHSQVTTPSVIVEGSAKAPGHLDPAVTFSTAGWEIANQIYQGLVAPPTAPARTLTLVCLQ